MSVNHEYRYLNGIESHLLTWNGVFDKSTSDVIVCVTGNPGLPDFYEEFGRKLHVELNIPVCVIGHAGHEEVKDEKSNMLKDQAHKFNLKGQLDHKIALINTIDTNARLHLVGHSIGAWMLIEILNSDDKIRARTASVQLLFPTLQKMAETGNGFIVNRILRKIDTLLLAFVALIFALPINVKSLLVSLYLKFNSLPAHYVDRILKYINPRVIEKVLFLAYDEMDSVTVLNREGIDKIKHMVNVIYSDNDGWVPSRQMDDLAEFEYALRRQRVKYNHAFVLKASDRVADLVAQYVKTKCA